MQDCQVLKRLRVFKRRFGDGGRFPHQGDFCGRDFADDAGGQRRSRERNPVEHGGRQAQTRAGFAHAVLAQFDERLQNFVAESFLRVDAQLFKNVVLALDAGDGFVHVGENGALQKIFSLAFDDEFAENVFVESLGNGFPFSLGIGQALKGRKEGFGGVDDFHMDAQPFEGRLHPGRFSFPHDAVVDHVGFEAVAQRLVSQGGDDAGVHAARERVDGEAVAHGVADVPDLVVDKFFHIHGAGFDFLHLHFDGSFAV